MEDQHRHQQQAARMPATQQMLPQRCPRCHSTNTKFCYFNNYSSSQPRHFCKSCRRYWTQGGTLRTVPVGGSRRTGKRRRVSSSAEVTNSASPQTSTDDVLPELTVQPSAAPPPPAFPFVYYGGAGVDIGMVEPGPAMYDPGSLYGLAWQMNAAIFTTTTITTTTASDTTADRAAVSGAGDGGHHGYWRDLQGSGSWFADDNDLPCRGPPGDFI